MDFAARRCQIRTKNSLWTYLGESNMEDTNKRMIKDSGSTTDFSTGAHRDARAGKGRIDLIPLEVASKLMDEDSILRSVREFQKDENTEHLYDALRSFCDRYYGGVMETMLLEVGIHYEEGANKYGANNWKKGMDTYIYIDSALRHYLKHKRGDMDEPHDRAFVWNLLCCIWEENYSERK